MATGLCVIFNHPFAAQIPLLREIYGERFPKILFIHPLDPAAAAPDVCVVYGGSYTFDLMVASARERILETFADCDGVLFLHNDALLNPAISARNFGRDFGVTPGTVLVCNATNMSRTLTGWLWGARAAQNFLDQRSYFANGSEAALSFLPDAQTAQEKARAAGLDDSTMLYPASEEVIIGRAPAYRAAHDQIFGVASAGEPLRPIDLGYPLFIGYSDFFYVCGTVLSEWLNYLGALGSMSLFCEVAVPTACVLAAQRLVALHQLGRGVQVLWGGERDAVENLEWMSERFTAGDVFIHPVKWNLLSESFLDRLRFLLASAEVPSFE